MCLRILGEPTRALPVLVELCVSWLAAELGPETIHLKPALKTTLFREQAVEVLILKNMFLLHVLTPRGLAELDNDALGIFESLFDTQMIKSSPAYEYRPGLCVCVCVFAGPSKSATRLFTHRVVLKCNLNSVFRVTL